MGTNDIFIFAFLTVIIPFGVVGNILSFVTWSVGKRCRHLHASCYFKPLAIIDTFILLVSGMEYLLMHSPRKIVLRDMNNVFCKFIPYLEYTSFCLSMWITTSLSIEKTCSLYMPFKFTNQKSHKRIYITIALLASVAFGMNVSFFFDYTVQEKYGYVYCNYPDDSFTGKYAELFKWFEIINVYIIPFIILIICNILILVKMYKRSNNPIGNRNNDLLSRRQIQLKYATYQVVAVCVIHCLTTVPYSAVYTIYTVEGSMQALRLFFVFYAMRYLNNATNFIIYCAIGSDFRQDFKDLLIRCCCGCCTSI